MLNFGLSNGAIVLPNILLAQREGETVTVTIGDAEDVILRGADALGLWQRLETLQESANFNWFERFDDSFLNVSKVVRYEDFGNDLAVTFAEGQEIVFSGVDAENILDIIENHCRQSDALFNTLKAEKTQK